MILVRIFKITLTFLRDMLGTNPMDADIHGTHVIDKERKIITEKSKVNKALSNKYLDASDISEERKQEEMGKIKERAEELMEIVGDLDEKGITVFFREDGKVCIGDHMIYGFLKAAAEAISQTLPKKNGTILHSASYTQSIINRHVSCTDEFIFSDTDIKRKPDGSPDYKVRSLRAQTPQGPRVTIAKSERIPKGAKLEFNLQIMEGSPLTVEALKTLLDYGKITGLGQWRNARNGSFTYEIEEVTPKPKKA
jgi:hypothetical protein